jgi:hypothetical protein
VQIIIKPVESALRKALGRDTETAKFRVLRERFIISENDQISRTYRAIGKTTGILVDCRQVTKGLGPEGMVQIAGLGQAFSRG